MTLFICSCVLNKIEPEDRDPLKIAHLQSLNLGIERLRSLLSRAGSGREVTGGDSAPPTPGSVQAAYACSLAEPHKADITPLLTAPFTAKMLRHRGHVSRPHNVSYVESRVLGLGNDQEREALAVKGETEK